METRWVTVSEAAALETKALRPLNKSSVSRFLARNEDVPVQRDDQGRVKFVDYDALVRARGQSLSVQDARPAQAAPPAASARVEDTASQRKRAADAESAEIDLAERKGELISRQATVSAVESAGLAFVQALERRRRLLAQRLTGLPDVRAVESILKVEDRKLLEALVKALGDAAGGMVAAVHEEAAEAA